MTTFTCQVYSSTTTLQVWDTNSNTVDKETENWLIPYFSHHILVNFVLCEQFTDNFLMALFTSQQEAVIATLKEGWQTRNYPCAETQAKHNTFKREQLVDSLDTTHAEVPVQIVFPHTITCGTQRHSVLYKTVGGVVGQEGSIESMYSKCKSAQNAQQASCLTKQPCIGVHTQCHVPLYNSLQ